jgi:hypothetical protein
MYLTNSFDDHYYIIFQMDMSSIFITEIFDSPEFNVSQEHKRQTKTINGKQISSKI